MKFTTTKSEKIPRGTISVVFKKNATGSYSDETLHINPALNYHSPELQLRRSIRKAVRIAHTHKIGKLAFQFKNLKETFPDSIQTPLSVVGIESFLADKTFTNYKTETTYKGLVEVILVGISISKEELEKAKVLANALNDARELSMTPGGDATPALLAKAAVRALKGTKAKVKVLSEIEIKKLKMGAILGVSKGSRERPRFIIIEYWGAKKRDESPLVYIGKGITFDSGGINLKPSEAILGMHMDMTGGAVVIHALAAIAKRKVRRNVIGIIPAAENMVSGESYRPGDILKSMSGKTIEVIDTDAEGRLVLADALTYAARYKPEAVIDIATLTGASIGALGQYASAFMTTNSKLREKLLSASEVVGESMWELPLWKEFEHLTDGRYADVANLPIKGNPRYGGAILGGAFLQKFAPKAPFAHIDIAPRMESTNIDFLTQGPTGEPLQTLVYLAEHNE